MTLAEFNVLVLEWHFHNMATSRLIHLLRLRINITLTCDLQHRIESLVGLACRQVFWRCVSSTGVRSPEGPGMYDTGAARKVSPRSIA